MNIFYYKNKNILLTVKNEDERSLHSQKVFEVMTIGISIISVRWICILKLDQMY